MVDKRHRPLKVDVLPDPKKMTHRTGIYHEDRVHYAIFGHFEDGKVRILDGWNLGMITARIVFPNDSTPLFFLSGKWDIPVHELRACKRAEMDPITWKED